MTDTTHDDLHRAQVDIWRYAQAEAAGALPAPRIGIRAADWITRHGRAYADMVEVCRRTLRNGYNRRTTLAPPRPSPNMAPMTTVLSARLETARKRLVTAALDQRHPSPELVRELNRYLVAVRHPAALAEDIERDEQDLAA